MLNFLLVDEHSIVRSGLRLLLGALFESILVDETSIGSVALLRVIDTDYDLVILDLNLPDTDILTMIKGMRETRPELRIFIFSTISDDALIKRCLEYGIRGYLDKTSSNEQISLAINFVLAGKRYVSSEILKNLLEVKRSTSRNPFDRLSAREFEISKLLLRGLPQNMIAESLNIQASTLGTHKAKIFGKLRVSNMVEFLKIGNRCDMI